MLYNYDEEKLSRVMQDFYNATGINITFCADDFSVQSHRNIYDNKYCVAIQNTEVGLKKCARSDAFLLEKCKKTRKAQVNICHAGLIDVAVPLIYGDDIIGYLILGQMKTDESFEAVEKYLKDIGTDLNKIQQYYNELTVYNEEKVQSVINIASILAKHILLENMLKPAYNPALEKILAYIEENMDSDLSVQNISKNTCVSVSVLYKYFHSFFGCTPKEYINRRRVENSVKYLENTDLSIEAVAQISGFSSASYYTRMFKKIKGISPLKFKKIDKDQ